MKFLNIDCFAFYEIVLYIVFLREKQKNTKILF